MKIGIIVDGDSEADSLPALFARIRTPHVILQQPVRGKIQP